MVFLPLKIETPVAKWPIMNMAVIVVTTLFFFLVILGNIPKEIVDSMVLRGWDPAGLFGNVFLHGGFSHLLGNMIFLWVFGNAICGLIGNGFYLPVYLFLGLCGSALHLGLSGEPAIGASGAVNGIVGMTLYFFPRNEVKMFIWIFYRAKTFMIKSYWVILFWFILDILGLFFGGDGVAHWAHVGGFVGGMALAIILDITKAVTTYDITLMDVFSGNTQKMDVFDGKLVDSHTENKDYVSTAGTAMLGAGDSMLEELRLQEKVQEAAIQSWQQQQTQWSTVQQSAPAAVAESEPSESKTTTPILRVMRAITRNDTVTCYFVNEGDTVHNLHIMAGGGIIGDINPKEKIGTKEAGAVRFTGCTPDVNFTFQLHFTENSEKLFTRIAFSYKDKKFFPVNPLG